MILARFVWFNRGLRLFACEVEAMVANGYTLKKVSGTHAMFGLRWLMIAEFECVN